MTLLQVIRRSTLTARSVLTWLVMSMAVAVAAPVVQPQASVPVCSAAGPVQWVAASGDGDAVAAIHTLDCVLCLAWYAAPPATVDLARFNRLPSGHAALRERAPVVLRSDATLTARAPPALI